MYDPMASMPQWHRDRIAADEAREQREMEAEQAERADRADTMARMAEANENMTLYRTGHSSAELREAASNAATAREMRNYQAEWGSASRAEVIITGAGGVPVRLQPVEATRAGSWTRDPQAELLKRSRAAGDDPFMQRMVAEFDARRGGKPAISRSETPPEIQCLDCIEDGHVTVDEYLELHHGDDPLPERRVPDHAPQRSRRVRSGTGWPELVR